MRHPISSFLLFAFAAAGSAGVASAATISTADEPVALAGSRIDLGERGEATESFFGNSVFQMFESPGGPDNRFFDSFTINASVSSTAVFPSDVAARGYLLAVDPITSNARVLNDAPDEFVVKDRFGTRTFTLAPRLAGAQIVLDPALDHAVLVTLAGTNEEGGTPRRLGFDYSQRVSDREDVQREFDADGAFFGDSGTLSLTEADLAGTFGIGVGSRSTDQTGMNRLATTITLVPEPGAVALAAAGGLFLLRRRA